MWFDVNLTFKEYTQKMIEKCKSVLKCLALYNWGASGKSLKRIYIAWIRSLLFMGVLFTDLHQRHNLKSLRLWCGTFRTSPVPAKQVETGEMPLNLRHLKLIMAY